jgi:microcystin-dependent protein
MHNNISSRGDIIMAKMISIVPHGVMSFKKLDTYKIGDIKFISSTEIPSGWFECNGAEISRTDFSELFEVIGTTFGEGDGINTFNLPDLRGEFIRGWDNGRGVDPGREFGSNQGDAFQGFSLQYCFVDSGEAYGESQFNANDAVCRGVGGGGVKGTMSTGVIKSDGTNGTPRTSNETRPRNVAFMFIIKAKEVTVNNPIVELANADTIDGMHAKDFIRYLDIFDRVGDIKFVSHEIVPECWVECDGRELSRAEYSELFGVIGTTFGDGDSSTTFNIPDLSNNEALITLKAIIKVKNYLEIPDPELEGSNADKLDGFHASAFVLNSDNRLVRPGTIIFIPRATPPAGYLKANGALLDRETYADLWAEAQASGALVDEASWANYPGAYSTGDGITTFRIPMIDGRTIIGAGQGGGLTYREMGASGGEEKHSLTADENGPHNHNIYSAARYNNTAPGSGGGKGFAADGTDYTMYKTGTSGSGLAHNNMQPYVALLACIKY